MTKKRASNHSGCSQNPLQVFMLICLNYWIEDPWTGIWVVVLLLPLVGDPVVQYICTSVSHPIYVYATLVTLLYSQKLLGGFLGFCNTSQSQHQQTSGSVPSIYKLGQQDEHRSSCLCCHVSMAVQGPLHDGKFTDQQLSKYKTAEYSLGHIS